MAGNEDFKLKELLETISEELKQGQQESRSTDQEEYTLEKPVCEHSEAIEGVERDLPDN